MRDNTPPRVPDIEDDEGELIHFDEDDPPDDDDDDDELDVQEHLESILDGFNYDTVERDTSPRTPVEDQSEVSFNKHAEPVYGCGLHPEHDLAVTGGEDDRAFLWNSKTGEVLHEFNDFKDTITEVHFNYDGRYLAIGDMSGVLQVFRVNDAGRELRKVWEQSVGDMAWMRWHRSANVLIAGSYEGEVYIWRIPSGDCKVLPGNGVKCETGELSHDGKKLFVGYENGTLKLWDLKQCSVIMEVDDQHPLAGSEVITSVACDRESPLYMSGGQDEQIIFCSNNGPIASVKTDGPVDCVAISPASELKIAASGTLHGEIAIWDLSKFSLRTLCDHPEVNDGVTRLIWLSDYTLLVGTLRGNIYGYDARSGVRKFKLSGHMSIIYEMRYDPRNNILLSASDDRTAKIFKVPQLGD